MDTILQTGLKYQTKMLNSLSDFFRFKGKLIIGWRRIISRDIRIILIAFFMVMSASVSMGQNFDWVKSFHGIDYRNILGNPDGTGGLTFVDMKVDNLGNTYAVGEFKDTVDFDPGFGILNLTTNGGKYVFILKLDAFGDLVWVRSIEGSNNSVRAMELDGSGYIYLTGGFTNTADFDPGPGVEALTSDGSTDIFILKLDTSGDFVWARKMGGMGGDVGDAIGIDVSGNIYITGQFAGTANFDPMGYYPLTGGGAFFSKLDPSGAFVFAKSICDKPITSLSVDVEGNIVLCTGYIGSVFVDGGAFSFTAQGDRDILILKLDTSGSVLWAKSMGGPGQEDVHSLATDASGNIYTTGSFNGPLGGAGGMADFDPGPDSFNLAYATGGGFFSPNPNTFISKLNSSGDFVWAKGITGVNRAYSIVLDFAGSVYVSGYLFEISDFDPGTGSAMLTPINSTDFFVLKLDGSGNYNWVQNFGGSTAGWGNFTRMMPYNACIAVDADKNIYTMGAFDGSVDFDPGQQSFSLTSTGVHYNWFMHKMEGGCSISSLTSQIACDSFEFNGTIYTTSGSYTHVFQSAANCDSIVTLNLTIGSDSVVINATACDSFQFNGISYSVSGTYIHSFTNSSNCDSTVTLVLTMNSNSSSYTVTETACDSFIFNGQTLLTSGIYTDTFPTSDCDSIVTLNLTINNSSTLLLTETACDSFVFDGVTYTSTGIYTHTFTSLSNCDSIVILHLTVGSDSFDVYEAACDSVYFNGTTYTNSGAYVHLFTNSDNCDSIVTLWLTIGHTIESTIHEAACDSFVYNNVAYTESGTYTITTSNPTGCDSVITLNLEVDHLTEATIIISEGTLIAGNENASYQWVDCDNGFAPLPGETGMTFTPIESGRYAVVVSNNCGIDTSDCITFAPNSINHIDITSPISVYPNPTNGQLIIESAGMLVQANIRVVNILGQLVSEKRNQNGNVFSVNLADVPFGIYFIEVIEGNRMIRTKIIRN